MSETNARSVAKGLSWRAIATTDTIILAFLFTGDVKNAFAIGGLELFTKTLLYYLHERLWLHMPIAFPFLWTEEAPEEVTHRKVSFLKAISWRFFGAIDTMILSFIVTGSLAASLSIGGTEVFTKVFLYYFHEHAWLHVKWGKRPKSS